MSAKLSNACVEQLMQNLYCATDKAQTADIEGSIALHFGENPLGTLTMVVKASSPTYI